jgi:hypothetical protein
MMDSNKDGFQQHNWDFKVGYKPMQWRSTVSAPLCAFCNKTVYPAEEVNGAGQKFHKLCLKCSKSLSTHVLHYSYFTFFSCMQYFTQFR